MSKLDPQAVAAANQKLWNDHPELGGRQLNLQPGDSAYRREWMKAYRQAVDQPPSPPRPRVLPKPVEKPPPAHAAEEPCIPCQQKAACADLWQKYDAEAAAVTALEDPIERNKKISAEYAKMYLRRNELKWSGAAAFASKQVGCGMSAAKAHVANPPAGAFAWVPGVPSKEEQKEMAQTMLDGLGKGNKAVFDEMYPAMRFYEDHGAERVKECGSARKPPLPDQISEGLKQAENGNPELGGLLMLENEQRVTLQREVYDNADFAHVIQENQRHVTSFYSSVAKRYGAEDIEVHMSAACDSGPAVTFTGKNLADYNERWPYASSVADKFNELSTSDPGGTAAELEKIIGAGG